jgi:hypothetical protein
MLGGLYDIRVSSDETDGAMAVIEFTIPEGAGPRGPSRLSHS